MKKKMVKGKYLLSLMYVMVFSFLGTSLSYAQGVTIGNNTTLNIGNGTLNVPGDIVNNGTLEASTGTINIWGDWVNNGTFTCGTGAVNFIIGDQNPVSISGSNQFYDLSAITGTGQWLELEAGATQTVINDFTLHGTSDNHLLLLRSTTDTVQAMIDHQGGGTQSLYYVDFKDINATGQMFVAANSINSGNNSIMWLYYTTNIDGDYTPDSWEIANFGDLTTANDTTDFDNDGLLDKYEYTNNTDPTDADSDNDGISDGEEVNTHGTDPNSTDTDGDGLSDGDEVNTHGTNPNSTDTDGDGMLDDLEITNGLNPLVDDAALDHDGDGLSNIDEVNIHGTDPNNPDTDGDGISDGVEVIDGTDPLVSSLVSVTVGPTSADATTDFTIQTQAATAGGAVQFRIFNDFNNNGIIDVDEWPMLNMVLADNGQGWINEGLAPDSNPSSPDITTVFSASGCNNINYLPVGNFIIQVKNAPGETGTAQFSITPASASQTVTGTVYEEGTTTPVPNALVEYNNSAGVLSLSFTDSNGAYVLQISTTGSGEICVFKDGYGENCLGLAVPAGGVSSYDLFLTPKDTQITGFVTDSETGTPVWGAEVWGEVANVWDNETWTYTNIDGSYTLPVSSGSVIIIGADKYGYLGNENNLTVPAGGVSNHNISITPATTQIAGIVTDSVTGDPICGAEVWVDTDEGESWNETGADGSFILPVKPGERAICVEHGGYMTSCNTLTVPAGGISNYSASLTPMDAQITGTVTESGTGNPLPGVNVWANPSGLFGGPGTITDNNGNFTLDVLSGTEWNVSANAPAGYVSTGNITLTPTVEGLNIADFILPPSDAQITGTITELGTGNPISGVHINANTTNFSPNSWADTVSENNGNFTLDVLSGTEWDVNVHRVPGYYVQDQPLLITPSVVGSNILSFTAEPLVSSPCDAADLSVKAYIDGRSQLHIQGSNVWWHHYDYVAPGEFGGDNPTVLNCVEWYPEWPLDTWFCDCDSSLYGELLTPLPADGSPIELQVIAARGTVSIVQQPTLSNDFTAIVEFNDQPHGGPNWYEIVLYYISGS